MVQDASGTILYANAAAVHILGLSVDQMRGLTAPDPRWRMSRAHGTDLLRHEHPALTALRASTAQGSAVWGVILPDGSRRWIQVDAIPLCAEPGGVVRVISDVTDLTLQRQADERLRRVYHALAGGVLVLDPQGRVVEANAAAEELLGVPLAAMRGQDVSSSLWEGTRPDGVPLADEERPVLVALRTGQRVRGVPIRVLQGSAPGRR